MKEVHRVVVEEDAIAVRVNSQWKRGLCNIGAGKRECRDYARLFLFPPTTQPFNSKTHMTIKKENWYLFQSTWDVTTKSSAAPALIVPSARTFSVTCSVARVPGHSTETTRRKWKSHRRHGMRIATLSVKDGFYAKVIMTDGLSVPAANRGKGKTAQEKAIPLLFS